MNLFSRQSRRPVSTNPRRVKLIIDHLEDRLTPSAFGPADGAYIVESWIGRYNDVKIQSTDQKIVAAGTMYTTQNNMAIARYDSLGNTDTGFGSSGVTSSSLGGTNINGQGLALQTDGKAIVTGYWGGTAATRHFVARIKTNGTFDSSYGSGGYTTTNFNATALGGGRLGNAVALQSTGKVVLASYEAVTVAPNPAVVARFTSSGALDAGKSGYGTVAQGKAIGYTFSTFGGNTNSFTDLVVQPDDKVVTVGYSVNDSTGGFLVARYTANGVLDTTFDGTGFNTLLPEGATFARSYGITRQGDGKLVTAGCCTGVDGSPDMLVARFNVNGTLDTSFGGGNGYVLLDVDGTTTQTNETAKDIVIQADGRIVVAGNEYSVVAGVDGPSSVMVARFNSDGTPDTTFGIGGIKLAAPPTGHDFLNLQMGVALQSNGNIIVAGNDRDGTNAYPMLMRFYGTSTPLRAASTPTITNTQTITLAQAQPLLTEAIARWQSAGFNVSSLSNINLRIADLPGTTIGQAQGYTITLDTNAAGWGWFVDKTPKSNSEFRTPGNQGEQGLMDLLTVLEHEVGHVLGFEHQQSGLMADTLFAGVRHSPTSAMNPAGHSSVDWHSIFGELHSLQSRKQW